MRRREFIKVIAGSAVWPLAANAQPSNKPVIGFLSARSAKESAHLVDAFRKGLAEYGLVEGQNVIIDYRWADSHYERLPRQAADLSARQPTVLISVGGDMTAKAATSATHTTPIVAVFIGDPVLGGFVASLSRPGGNITGVSNLNAVIEAKRIGLLRERGESGVKSPRSNSRARRASSCALLMLLYRIPTWTILPASIGCSGFVCIGQRRCT
jgi:ABC-type uncharacterized transport system substrate-binding protein